MTTNSLYENDSYKIFIADSVQMDKPVSVYHVFNKTTGITEVETTLMPRALEYAKSLDEELKAFYEESPKSLKTWAAGH